MKYFFNINRAIFLSITLATTFFLTGCQNFENFDSVTPPALPAGWTSSGVGGEQWVTVADSTPDRPSDTAPNSAFVKSANNQDVGLTSPLFTLKNGGSSEVSLKHRCKTENGWDGGILEISENGGAFVNISSVGNFLEGPYRVTPLATTPFGVTNAWTGETNYVTSRISLPNFAEGTTLKFKFRLVSDPSISTVGCSVDTVSLNGADLVVTKVDSQDPVEPGASISYTVTVQNNGPLEATSVILYDVLPKGFALVSSTLSQGSFTNPNPPVLRANLGTIASGASAFMTLTGNAPSSTPRAPVVRIDSPSTVARNITAGEASFGPALNSTGVSGLIKLASDGVGVDEDACENLPAGFATGNILLMQQSASCSFNQQVQNAETAGAIGAVVFAASSDALLDMGSSGIAVNIPSAYVGVTDGKYLKSSISSGASVTVLAFENTMLNEVRADAVQMDPDLQNSFATEFPVVAFDTDKDGVIDPSDGCAQDAGKTEPGVCGCGVPDVDSNSNGVLDCLATAELKAQAQSLSAALSALKSLPSNAKKQQRAAQKTAKNNLKSSLNSLSNFVKASGVNVTLLNNKVPLSKLHSQVKSAVSTALKLNTSFARDKKNAAKLIKKLIAAIG